MSDELRTGFNEDGTPWWEWDTALGPSRLERDELVLLDDGIEGFVESVKMGKYACYNGGPSYRLPIIRVTKRKLPGSSHSFADGDYIPANIVG